MTEHFQFPKTRKSREAKHFIAAVEAAKAPDADAVRLAAEGKAEQARLNAIVHDPKASYADKLNALALLGTVHDLDQRIYGETRSNSEEAARVPCQEVFELALEEAEHAALDEVEALQKSLPKGVKIDASEIETPARAAYRELATTHPDGRARMLFPMLTR